MIRHFDFEAAENAVEAVTTDGERIRFGGDVSKSVFEQLRPSAQLLVEGSLASECG